MNTDNKQSQLTPNESAASLMFATHLQDGMQQHHAEQSGQNTPQTQEMPQEGTENPQEEQIEQTDIKKELEDFKKSVDDTIKTSIGEIKDMIKSALAEDDKTDAKEESTETTK